MNNDEIRLSILFQFYRAAFNGKGYGDREENPELKDIPHEVITPNLIYLVDKNLINGKKYYTSGGVHASTSDITAWGMDIVEKIMNNSLDELDQEVTSEIKKEESTNKRLEKFYEKCVKVVPMCEVAVKVAGMVFANL